jgi:putative CocE/NonD family hydrolase
MTPAHSAQSIGNPASVVIDWGVRIPMRDGISLHGVVYRPKQINAPLSGVVTITPYIADSFHEAGVFFASSGFLFVVVDCRGRGNSQGKFRSFHTDGIDGHDVVEWLSRHPLCNGKVAMGGGSYSGRNQWSTAMHTPPHLATIMPRCASYPGLDFPIRNNIGEQYTLQWLAFTAGNTLQNNLFRDQAYWSALWRDRFCKGRSFASLAAEHPVVSEALAEWIAHPEPDAYWDAFNPTPEHYASMSHPVLTVTGIYDDDQHGALAYYRMASAHGSRALRDANYLVIGPWDHEGVGAPKRSLDGVDFGADGVIDMRAFSAAWYQWTMADGERPALLADNVAYYVTGAKEWRHAPSLEAITNHLQPLYLTSCGSQPRLSQPGRLSSTAALGIDADQYIYDPLDVSTADLELDILPYNIADTRLLEAQDGKQLVYDSEPFERDTELSGFFRLDAWMGIDQPDTDFRVLIYILESNGRSVLLTNDTKRARYGDSLREPRLAKSPEPRLYSFDTFWFTSRLVRQGERIRLVIGPYNSIYTQKNFNSGKKVADETSDDAKTVTVTLKTGGEHDSVLYLPVARMV